MKKMTIVTILTLLAMQIIAGDLYVLENLGFSSNGQYFMFGQHVFQTNSGQAYAEAAIVNVWQNEFVADGWKKRTWQIKISPSFDSRGALFELLGDMSYNKKKFGISHLEQGRLIYTKATDADMMMSEDGMSEPVLKFRDFERGRDYSLLIYQESQSAKEPVSTSFYIDLTVENTNGQIARYTIGRPNYMRPNIVSYYISRVWLGPDGNSLVLAVAKEHLDMSINYMVEALRLN